MFDELGDYNNMWCTAKSKWWYGHGIEFRLGSKIESLVIECKFNSRCYLLSIN